ncbi:unnamed protein product, partial [Heterosigma akashiwo]
TGFSHEKIVGWAHPKAIMIACEGARHWFIDGTFRVVPLGFYQLLVLMIYIPSMNLAIPIFSLL